MKIITNFLNKNLKIFDNSEPVKLRNYYLYTGYTFESKNQEFEYEPSIYLKYFVCMTSHLSKYPIIQAADEKTQIKLHQFWFMKRSNKTFQKVVLAAKKEAAQIKLHQW